MPSFSNKVSSTDEDVSSTATSSQSPIANRLYLLSVNSRAASVEPNEPTASGAGLTFTTILSVYYDTTSSSRKKYTLMRAMSASPSSGAITISFGGQTQTDICYSLNESSADVDTSGTNGSGAIVQSASNSTTSSGTTFTATLGAFASANNSTFGGFGLSPSTDNNETQGSGFTLLAHPVIASTGMAELAEYRTDNDTSVDVINLDSGSEAAGVAIEVKAATATTAALTGTLSFVGAATKSTVRGNTGALSFIGSIVKRSTKVLSAALSFVGALTSVRLVLVALSGAVSFVGAFVRSTVHGEAGELPFSGVISRVISVGRSGVLSFSGVISRVISVGRLGVLSFSGSVARSILIVRSASVGFVGSLASSRFISVAVGATLDFAGTVVRKISVAKSAVLSFAGNLVSETSGLTQLALSATLTFTGDVKRSISSHLTAASLNFVGNLQSGGVTFFLTLAGTLDFVGNLLQPSSVLRTYVVSLQNRVLLLAEQLRTRSVELQNRVQTILSQNRDNIP